MFLNTLNSGELTTGQIIKIIDEATIAEICRDHQSSMKAFRSIWTDVEKDPDFSKISQPALRAELYRLAGFFLCYYGKSKIKKHYLERARPLIIKSINIFQDLKLKEKADEANISLALCYWYLGDPENSELILSQIESDYEDNPFDSPYLLVKITRSLIYIAREEFDKALKLVESMEDKINYSSNQRVKMSYHNKAGAMFLRAGRYDKALAHFANGIKQSINMNSLMFQGSQYNNIAAVYKELAKNEPKYYEDAFLNIDKALELFDKTDAPGWTAVTLDTKADILLEKGDFQKALVTINEAIELMRDGDDNGVLTDAVFLRAQINFKLKNLIGGIQDVAESAELARVYIGDFKVEQIKKKTQDILYIKTGDLSTELDQFKKHIVGKSLVAHGFHRDRSAEAIGLTRTGLLYVVDIKHPELYDELGFSKRHWGPTSKKYLDEKKEKIEKSTGLKLVEEGLKIHQKATIMQMDVTFDQIVYPGKTDSDKSKMQVFYVPREIGEVARNDDSVVLCKSTSDYSQIQSLIILNLKKTKTFLLALAGRNDINKTIYVQDIDTGVNLDPAKFKIIGKIVGFCSSADSVGEVIVFKSFGGNK